MFYIYIGLSTIGTCNLVFYQTEAIMGSALTLVWMFFWYKDGLELYNLFKWTEADEEEFNDYKSMRKEIEDGNDNQGYEGNCYDGIIYT